MNVHESFVPQASLCTACSWGSGPFLRQVTKLTARLGSALTKGQCFIVDCCPDNGIPTVLSRKRRTS